MIRAHVDVPKIDYFGQTIPDIIATELTRVRAFMAKVAPQSVISTLQACGHALLVEQPAAVAQVITDAIQACRVKTIA